jgi:hypothetical protein
VDLSDLGTLATNYGAASGALWSQGDYDNDGDVDLNDLGTIATNYGAGAAQAFADFQTLTVPEPSAGLGVFLGTLLCARSRVGYRRQCPSRASPARGRAHSAALPSPARWMEVAKTTSTLPK